MKIRAIIVSFLLLCCLGLIALSSCGTAQSQNEQKVNMEIVQEEATPGVIKEMITRMKDELEKDYDRFPELITEVENYITNTSNTSTKAVLHSMAAEMYTVYFIRNRGNVLQRTSIIDYTPQDVREWSENLFTEKIKEHLLLSLQPAKQLQQTPATSYAEILEKGKDAETLRPTLYDFLAQRAVQIQASDDIYKEWLTFRRGESNPKATLLVELSYLEYIYNQKQDEASKKVYEKALEELMKQYAGNDYSTEIRIAQVNLLDKWSYQTTNTDSIFSIQSNILKEGISRFPDYERIGILKNKLAAMEQPLLTSQVPQTAYPKKDMPITLNYKNVSKVTIRIHQSLLNSMDLAPYQSVDKKKTGKLIKEVSIALANPHAYSTQDTIIYVPMSESGIYECVIDAPDHEIETKHIINVSKLAAVSRASSTGIREVLITDFLSGKPIQNVNVAWFSGKRQDLREMDHSQTDKDGLVVIPNNKDILAFQATLANDTSRITTLYPEYVADGTGKIPTDIALFTDRGLYRPGQTVYYKGIAYKLNKDKPALITKKEFTVILRDANYKEITTRKIVSNEFGSFNGEFTLPKQTLTGNFSITVENSSANIRVEEYKRPTFSVEMLPVNEDVTFGDIVTIKGKVQTFSGVSLQEGQVDWRIIRRPFWLLRGAGSYQQEQVAQGTTKVDTEGGFSISFRPEKITEMFFPYQYYNYEVTATVTDSKGETQETRFNVPIGDTSMILSLDMPLLVNKNNVNASINARLLNGEKTTADGTFKIISLIAKDPKKSYSIFTEGSVVTSGNFSSDKALAKDIFKSLNSGRYRIKMEAKDRKGRKVEGEQDFTLYSDQDKRPPVYTHSWLIIEKDTCMPGEEAKWIFGTSDKESYVLYEVFQNNKRLLRKRIILDNENQTFTFPFKEEYGDGVVATFTYVKEGDLFVTQVPICRKQPDRKLTIRPETFRDRLLPGSTETWKFRITDKDSLAVSAEVLASMYDSSLDQIIPFNWYFSPERSLYLQAPRFIPGEGFGSSYQHGVFNITDIRVPNYAFDEIDWQGIFFQRRFGMDMFNTRSRATGGMAQPMMKSADPNMMMDQTQAQSLSESPVLSTTMSEEKEDIQGYNQDGQQPQQSQQLQPRTNFNETAFFYPTLLTNAEGDLIVSFTIPESNTSWKVQTIAHTKELKYGQLTQEVITSKPLMVVPNLPRFLRQGDRVSLSTQILNQQEEAISGKVHLEWFDPSTDKPIQNLNENSKSFKLASKGQTTIQWTITVPLNTELLGCRIIADASAGSDGEQHLIPVLSNQILITESTPFYILNKGEQKININQPRNSNPFRMTLEVSGNPVWYAVQALPTITTPTNDNILEWFASYYGNTLATSIASAHPRIQQMISQWTAQGGNASTLISNLEKNEELKNILLEETPWVLAADNETEQKQRLSLLFDINRANSQREVAMQRLIDQQREDGSWGWFKGFAPDRNMTLSILKGMNQLVLLSAVQYNQQEKEMQMRALQYLDKSIQEEYNSLKKFNKNWEKAIPSPQQIEYLYIRSCYRDIPELGDAREAIRFYTTQAEKNWSTLSLNNKGQVAILMHRNGKKEVANEILAWLRKTATTTKEQGMFWANNQRGSDFNTSPVDVHSLLMYAFRELSPNTDETNKMKQWLLNQKRTQNWESTPATINAIYAILLTGNDWLNENNTLTVQWGNKNFSTTEGEAGTGYLKESLTGSEISEQANNLIIRKEGEAPAWGAVYNQYFTQIDQTNAQKGVLNVEKKLFIETNNGKERQIRPVNTKKTLHIGDKVIVRLTIRTDREMDYVSLKDLRAGCFEPGQQLSGLTYQNGISFYRTPKDVSENFFFQRLPKGTFVIEYPVFVSRSGEYTGGISTIQCMYAPEFVSHTEGNKLIVKD